MGMWSDEDALWLDGMLEDVRCWQAWLWIGVAVAVLSVAAWIGGR